MKEKDIHIEILKWAKNNPSFTSDELISKFPDEKQFLEIEIDKKENSIFTKRKSGESKEFLLSFEGRFKLLQYQELEEARKSSKWAIRIAIIAIIITLTALASQIWHTRYFTEDVNVINIPHPN